MKIYIIYNINIAPLTHKTHEFCHDNFIIKEKGTGPTFVI